MRAADAVTASEFIAKWRASELKERSASQEHFIDLCRLLGEPTPADADPTGERYCFERGARKDTGGDGWADVWKRVLSKNTNELKTGAPGRFDRHRPMASPRSGACRRRCRRFGVPVRAGKTPSSNGMNLRSRAETWIQARAAPGPERASRLRRGSPGLDSGPVVSKNTNELKTGGASGITSICRRVPYGTCLAASG